VWSYTNRWGKATGANLDGKHREDYFAGMPDAAALTYDAFGTHRLARNGDYYPPNDDARFPELSANVVFVQLHPSSTGLDVRVVLNSLGQRDSSIVTLALATGTGTATSTLPRGAGLRCTGCGVERYVTVWGTGSDIATAAGRSVGAVQNLTVDTAENTVSFHVPGVASSGTRLRAWLASGLHDGSGHYLPVQASQSATSPGGGNGTATNVFDLAFVRSARSTIDERVQSDLLARGDLAPAQASIDLTALRAGTQRVEGEPSSGPVEKVLVSANNGGQGIDNGNGPASFQNPGPGQNFHYLGRTQGYLVDLPPGYQPGKAVPEVMVLHGYNGYYDEEYFLAAKMRAAIEKLGYIGVYPLGRGDVQYEHDGELDLLEVQRAVQHDYAIDTSRVHLVGISMGGFGATKAAVRHADIFARCSSAVNRATSTSSTTTSRSTRSPARPTRPPSATCKTPHCCWARRRLTPTPAAPPPAPCTPNCVSSATKPTSSSTSPVPTNQRSSTSPSRRWCRCGSAACAQPCRHACATPSTPPGTLPAWFITAQRGCSTCTPRSGRTAQPTPKPSHCPEPSPP